MQGASPRRVKRSFLPTVNDDPSTMTVVDVVFFGADDCGWGSPDPDKPEQIRTQGPVVFYVGSAAYAHPPLPIFRDPATDEFCGFC